MPRSANVCPKKPGCGTPSPSDSVRDRPIQLRHLIEDVTCENGLRLCQLKGLELTPLAAADMLQLVRFPLSTPSCIFAKPSINPGLRGESPGPHLQRHVAVELRVPILIRFFRKLLKRQGCVPRRLIHRQTAQLSRGLPHRDAVRDPQYAAVRKQPSRGLPPTDQTTRAPDTALQICCPRATVSLSPRTHPESLSCRPSPAPSCSPPVAQNAVVPHLG